MRTAILGLTVALAWSAAVSSGWAQKPPAAPKASPKIEARPAAAPVASRAQDENAIRAAADAFTQAYNAHDAARVAALFAPDAEIVGDDGTTTQGRSQIEQVFAAIFEDSPEARIALTIESIRFVSPAVAVEDGSAVSNLSANDPEERNRYMVVHVKQDGKWLMASARDLSEEPSGEEELRQLDWMVGEWVDESEDVMVDHKCRRSEDGHYLLGEFTIQLAGRPAMKAESRIGWDPRTRQIKSWVFDSVGGYSEGLWTRVGDRWIVKMSGVRPDGSAASATNSYVPLGHDKFQLISEDRLIGGEQEPDTSVIVVRKPPPPSGT